MGLKIDNSESGNEKFSTILHKFSSVVPAEKQDWRGKSIEIINHGAEMKARSHANYVGSEQVTHECVNFNVLT